MEENEDTYPCEECNMKFARIFTLKRHVLKKHPEKFKDFAERKQNRSRAASFKCTRCPKTYRNKRHLNYHMKKCHSLCAPESKLHKCPLCLNEFSKSFICEHFETAHEIKMENECLKFSSFQEFLGWKILMEKDTKCSYSKVRFQENNDTKLHYYDCHRSGYYKPKGKGIRELKVQGSKKINAFCPSMMKVHENLNECTVWFQKAHVGHEDELRYLCLNTMERKNLAIKLAAKLPLDTILDDIRNSISDDGLQRLHLLTKKDLHNIEASFNIDSDAVRHENDATSVEMWVNEVEDFEKSCVIFYKPQGSLSEGHSDLNADDFVLIIMNEAQEEILKKFGYDTICIDSTHGLNSYGFELTTLLVLDDLRQGFPCAFIISNRCDENIMRLFFHEIQKKIGVLNSKVFMSDIDDFFYNAWCEIMTAVKNRLYCTWLVDRAWRMNLKKIKSKEKQVEVYKLLRTLLEERDQFTFTLMLEKAYVQLKDDEETKEFAVYFAAYYMKNIESWAYCYRLHAGVNCKMHIERMHKTLKDIYLQGKTVKRLDKAIHAIMKFLRDKLFDRLIILSKGKISKKLNDLRQRHKISLGMRGEILRDIEREEWHILSSDADEIYVVKEHSINCTCQLKCNQCKACIHAYICSCPDSAIKWNMCKHIHFLCNHGINKDTIDTNIEEDLTLEIVPADTEPKILVKQLQNEAIASITVNRKERLKRKILNILDMVETPEEFKYIEDNFSALEPKLMAIRANSHQVFCHDQPSASLPHRDATPILFSEKNITNHIIKIVKS